MKPTPGRIERLAARVLEARGWRLTEPVCPLCYGNGYVPSYTASNNFDGAPITTGDVTHDPCPDGCPSPGWYFTYSGSTTTVTVGGPT